jgi:hypothetical protein
MDMLGPDELRTLASAGAVVETLVIADGRRWRCEVRTGLERRAVATRRGGVRYWSSLDSAARYLRERGIARWAVDATQWVPEQGHLADSQGALV